jgi:hypothetical protein
MREALLGRSRRPHFHILIHGVCHRIAIGPPIPVVVREVEVVCGCEEVPGPEKSRASESASLLLKSELDGGRGEDGGSLSV